MTSLDAGAHDRCARHASRFEYDALDRRVATFAPDADGGGPLGEAVTRFAYDANDNLVSVTDPLGHVTQYGYDVLDRRVEVIDARGASSTMTYDASGNLLSLDDVLGRITTNEYDGLGRLIKTRRPIPKAPAARWPRRCGRSGTTPPTT